MKEDSVIFIGLDTSKLKISVAVADGDRNGEVRFFGDISSEPASVASMVDKLSKRGAELHFCYEAGPTGYGLYRQIVELGHECVVVAPSLVPTRPGDPVKTNRRDAVSLARLHRAGLLTSCQDLRCDRGLRIHLPSAGLVLDRLSRLSHP
jgi:transposase